AQLASMMAENAAAASKLQNALADSSEMANVAAAMNKALENHAFANALANESALANEIEALASRSK
ncbi:MAG: hypothetical protein ABR585_15990, partial [Gemmatimonadaceae bacterium]